MKLKHLLIASVLCASTALSAEAPTIHRKQVCEPAAAGWCRAVSTPAQFSAEFPAAVNDFSVLNSRLAGGELAHIHGLGVLQDARVEWSTTCLEYIEGKPDDEAIVGAMLQQAEMSSPRIHQGVRGFSVKMKRGTATQFAAIYVGEQFSCIQLVEVRSGALPSEAARERYFDSLRFPPGF